MKIYTRSGDDGTTGLYGGGRVAKNELRIEAFGDVDELNAQLGVVRTLDLPKGFDEILDILQNQMFDLGAELATPAATDFGVDALLDEHVVQLEEWIDYFEAGLAPLRTFILPGGSPSAAGLHFARCICRRAERKIVALAQMARVRTTVLKYINRVGDLLFVMARSANAEVGRPDVPWRKLAGK